MSGLSAPVANALTKAAAKAGRPVLAVPPGPLGTFAAADAAAGLGGRGRVLERRRADELGRDGRLRRRRPGVGLRPPARGRRAARAAAAGRVRLPDRQQPAAARRDRRDLQARRRPGTTSARSRSDGFSAVAGPHRRAPAHGPGAGDRARRWTPTAMRAVNTSAADEAAVDLPERRVVDVVRRAARGRAGRAARCSAARPRGSPARCARGSRSPRSRSRCASATATSRSPPARPRTARTLNAVLSGAANDLGGALATIDAYTGTPPTRHRRQRAAEGPPRRRPGVHPRRHAPGARAAGPAGARPGLAAARPRRHARPAPTRSGSPATRARGNQRVRFVGQDADQGEDGFTTIILGDEDERDEGGDPGPARR